MNRIAFAAVLAATGFTVAAAAQTAPSDSPDRAMTRDDAMAQADRRFERMDTNKDGKIDASEIAAMRPTAPPPGATPPADGAAPPPPPRPGGRLLARLDTNGDGVIDRAEFRAQAAQRFDRADANKDGVIDAAEREAARDAMGIRGGRGRGAGGDMPPPPPTGTPQPDAGQ